MSSIFDRDVQEKFRRPGYIPTMQHRTVLWALGKVKAHLSARDVYLIVKKDNPRVTLSIVYQALSVLEVIGLIEAKHWPEAPNAGRYQRSSASIASNAGTNGERRRRRRSIMPRTVHGITYTVAGQGEPVILLHGIGSNSLSWRRQLEDLSERYMIVAWDAPGYKGSSDPDRSWQMADYASALNTFLDDLGLARVHLVGLSMGGVIAAEFCRSHQDRLLSLVLADTHRGGAAKEPPEAQDRALKDRLTAFHTKSREEFARERVPRLLSPEAPPQLIEDAVDIMKEVRSPSYEIAAVALAKSDVRDVLPEIRVPTLVICGEFDRVCPPEEAERIAAAIPETRLALIPGGGHLSNQERPTEFNDAVDHHISSA